MKTVRIIVMTTEYLDVEEELYDKVEAILEAQGMTMQQCIDGFLRYTAEHGALPFALNEEDKAEIKPTV